MTDDQTRPDTSGPEPDPTLGLPASDDTPTTVLPGSDATPTAGPPWGAAVPPADFVYEEPATSDALSMAGQPIANLSAFDLDGNPIPGFQLFDQDGNPVVADTSAVEYGPNGELVLPVMATDKNGYPVNEAFPLTYVMVNEYVDEVTGEVSLQVSRVLTSQRVAPLTGLTPPVVPAVGSLVPLDDEGNPDWAAVQPPPGSEASTPSPSPSPTEGGESSPTESGRPGQSPAAPRGTARAPGTAR